VPEIGPYELVNRPPKKTPPKIKVKGNLVRFAEFKDAMVLRGPFRGFWCKFDYVEDYTYKMTKIRKLKEDEITQGIYPSKILNQNKRI
jgi:hypothetical protein